jgi:hypothetical protein
MSEPREEQAKRRIEGTLTEKLWPSRSLISCCAKASSIPREDANILGSHSAEESLKHCVALYLG